MAKLIKRAVNVFRMDGERYDVEGVVRGNWAVIKPLIVYPFNKPGEITPADYYSITWIGEGKDNGKSFMMHIKRRADALALVDLLVNEGLNPGCTDHHARFKALNGFYHKRLAYPKFYGGFKAGELPAMGGV